MHKLSPADAGFLTKQQKQDFQDCFLLLDTEKTGRLNVDDLTSAFQLLNIEVTVSSPYSSHITSHSHTVTYHTVAVTIEAWLDVGLSRLHGLPACNSFMQPT